MTTMTTHPGRRDPSTHPSLPDQAAEAVLEAVMHLAVVLRDDPTEVLAAAGAAVEAAGGDAVAALCVAAALVNVDAPIDAWWQAGLDGVRSAEPVVPLVVVRAEEVPRLPGGPRGVREHGSHKGYNQHQALGEDACEDCLAGERLYSRNRQRVRRGSKPRRSAVSA